jgi:DNA-binding CsgD family transcriptional regulator
MILEREAALARLSGLLDESVSAGGKVVLIRGEAGIGKSTLVNRFLLDFEERAHTLLGACDDLLTPQPFGPIWDISRSDPSIVQPLSDGDRREVMEALLALLSRAIQPTVLVLEDTQWADEATLDVIKFLGRRIAPANGLLILTYRDVEVDSEHPLRQVIGELPPQNIERMSLDRLSVGAVSAMIESDALDIDAVMALTSGNPLFVTEVLAAGSDAVPLSVMDAVLARASKVSAEARRVLDLVSVVPGQVERSLVHDIWEPTEEQLAENVHQGLLRVDDEMLSFPHELQRRAIESSLTAVMRRSLNQLVLDTLGATADPARLVHHAAEAEDIDAIVRLAPLAARVAMTIESNTEAVAHFRSLAPYLDRVEAEERCGILADWAQEENYLDNRDCIDLFARAIDLYRLMGDNQGLGQTLTMASRANRTHGNHGVVLNAAKEAVVLLEPFGPSLDLVKALSHRAYMEFAYTDADSAVLPHVDRAIAAAQASGEELAVSEALHVKAQVVYSRGDDSAMTLMEEVIRLAGESNDHQLETRALLNMASMYGDVREVERASELALAGRDLAVRFENRAHEASALVLYSEFQLWKGDWVSAENAATEALGSNLTIEAMAWRVLGSIQSRRGRKEARSAVDNMWSRIAPELGPTDSDAAAAAFAEYMWLSDDRDPSIVKRLEELLSEGIELGTPWPSGGFAFWMWKLGLLDDAPEGTADFYGWIINGEYKKSAEFWRERGISYEEGLALMHRDESEQVEALHIFDDLGAGAIAAKVRQALIENGKRVPRGRSRVTRENVAGLTARQSEVLELLAMGMTNAEIANDLFVSHRTVENHVSAILMKLDVASRDAAVEAAREMGILRVA